MERHFIDWRRPFLPAAAEWMADRYATASAIDLSEAVLVFPGRRAARRFLELLLASAERRGAGLDPPRCVTTGSLPELLVEPRQPLADPIARELAWMRALESSPLVEGVTSTKQDPEEGPRARVALARMLDRMHRELAREGLDFAQALERGRPSMPSEEEERRWGALAEAQRHYRLQLRGAGLADPFEEPWQAMAQRRLRSPRAVVLVSVVEPSRVVRELMRRVTGERLVLVHAPLELANRFDEMGGLVTADWQTPSVDLPDEWIEFGEGPASQADVVIRHLESLPDGVTRADVTLGVADEELIPYLGQALDGAGLRGHDAAGLPLSRSDPYQLLRGIAGLLRENRFEDLAALVRHPRVRSWLRAEQPELVGHDPLTLLDGAHREHLPQFVEDLLACRGDRALRALVAGVRRLLGPLEGPAQPLREWGDVVLEVLARLYDGDRAALDPVQVEALDALARVCANVGRVETSLGAAVTAREAVELVLRHARTMAVAAPPTPGSIELLGWLELRLDDAPVSIVAGVNEGRVPEFVVGDPFLPDALRGRLGLADNRRRAARDAYALSAMASDGRRLRLVAGRRSRSSDPLRPSRLLLACASHRLPARVLRFVGATTAAPARPRRPVAVSASLHPYFREPPRPEPKPPLEVLGVTAFGDYLRCPYRFYLKHVLGLRAVDDQAPELDGGGFGRLAHEILMRFGRSEQRHSESRREIVDQLFAELDVQARRRFGPRPRAALEIQLEQLRARLAAFAAWQARRTREGWRIEGVELVCEGERSRIVVDDQPMALRGRIDRVERHATTGRVAILDFKTSDRAISPEAAHRVRGEWIDLQLPLYAWLFEQTSGRDPGAGSALELAYLCLPRDLDGVAYEIAPWSLAERNEALAVARDVVRRVRAGEFWPPTTPPPPFADDYAGICLDEQFLEPADQAREAVS